MAHGSDDARATYSRFVASSYNGLLREAVLLTGDRMNGEDLLQSALMKVYRHWSKINVPAAARSYTRTTMVRLVASDSRRRGSDERASNDLDDVESSGPSWHDVDTRQDILRTLQSLQPRQRAAVVMRYYIGMTEKETAEAMDVSVAAAKSLCARGMRQLRTMMDVYSQREVRDSERGERHE
ncbi:MAG: SigE family RNA polymerase sigma factor [Mycobacteriales bacterium]